MSMRSSEEESRKAPPSVDDWKRFAAITKDELAATVSSTRAQIVDVLEVPSPVRIPGARAIPLSALETRLGELDRGRDVIVYCKGVDCPLARRAARLLTERGFHVRVYEGGIDAWKAANLPVEPAAKAVGSESEKEKPKAEAKGDEDASPKKAEAKSEEDAAPEQPSDTKNEADEDGEDGQDGEDEGADQGSTATPTSSNSTS